MKPLAPGIYEHPLTIGLDARASLSGEVAIEPLKAEQVAPILAKHLARECVGTSFDPCSVTSVLTSE